MVHALCMVPASKVAAASGVPDHSMLLCKVLSHPPSFHLLVNTTLFVCACCRTLATEVNMHDFGVRFPLKGLTVASMIALLTTS